MMRKGHEGLLRHVDDPVFDLDGIICVYFCEKEEFL